MPARWFALAGPAVCFVITVRVAHYLDACLVALARTDMSKLLEYSAIASTQRSGVYPDRCIIYRLSS
jgi:hypothetical protein